MEKIDGSWRVFVGNPPVGVTKRTKKLAHSNHHSNIILGIVELNAIIGRIEYVVVITKQEAYDLGKNGEQHREAENSVMGNHELTAFPKDQMSVGGPHGS